MLHKNVTSYIMRIHDTQNITIQNEPSLLLMMLLQLWRDNTETSALKSQHQSRLCEARSEINHFWAWPEYAYITSTQWAFATLTRGAFLHLTTTRGEIKNSCGQWTYIQENIICIVHWRQWYLRCTPTQIRHREQLRGVGVNWWVFFKYGNVNACCHLMKNRRKIVASVIAACSMFYIM